MDRWTEKLSEYLDETLPTGEREALEAVAHAIDEHHSLVLNEARYEREPEENGVVINLANVVSMRVSKADGAATGQYI